MDELAFSHTAISLFAGGGGLDLGAAYAGFDVKYASDLEAPHCETLAHNFKTATVETADIRELSGKSIRKASGRRSFDLLIGGPPCQSFSILGKRLSVKDPRGMLVYEFARLVKELRPRAFVFENVPGLTTIRGGKDWKKFVTFLSDYSGYQISHQILNAADYGVPQIRRRVFLVGFRKRTKFAFPKPTHSVDGSLGDRWVPAQYVFSNTQGLKNQKLRVHCERVRSRYETVLPGERDRVDHTDRIHPAKPSGTVLVGSGAGGGRPFIHPSQPRHITVREAARLQSFPDWYEFRNTETWQYRAVGNAVPVLMAKSVLQAVAAALR